jgi:hypothetical protein
MATEQTNGGLHRGQMSVCIALTDFDDEDEVRRKVMDGIWDRRCLFGRRSPRAGP